MQRLFAPGCALELFRPALARRLHEALESHLGAMALVATCCRRPPDAAPGSLVVNTCPGCDRRYRELYEGISTISAWEVLAGSETFPFPSYGGARMAVHDACPTRSEPRVHDAVRALLARMDIVAVEPPSTRAHAVCCGDSLVGLAPEAEVREQMARRARTMPCREVVVYCVSCVKAMHIGGNTPRYLVDLLFGEETTMGTFEPEAWHSELDAFIAVHTRR